MVASKNQSIWFIVLSILKLVVGVIVLILCKFMVDAAMALAEHHSSFGSPGVGLWWLPGIPYIVPAVFGLAAAKTKQNAFIGLYMALNIIAMVVAGIFAVLSLMYVTLMSSVGGISCHDVADQCYCGTGNGRDTLMNIPVNECDSLNKIFGLTYGVTAMIITGWALCLTASIVCCSACCCAPANSSGVVYVQPAGGYTTTIQTGYAIGAHPPPYSPPPVVESEEMMGKENFKYSRMP